MGNPIAGLICLAIAYGIYTFNETAQAAANANKKISQWGHSNCHEFDWTIPMNDHVDGCYYWFSDFRIEGNAKSENILPENLQCDKIQMHQVVQQWQSFEVTVCDSYKRGQLDESQHHEYDMSKQSEWDDETKKAYEADMKSSECHTETVYDWHDVTSSSWNFPSSNEVDHGQRTFMAEGLHHTKQGVNYTSENHKIYWGHSEGGRASDLVAWIQMMIRANAGPDSKDTVNPVIGTFYDADVNEEFIRLNDYPIDYDGQTKQEYPLCLTQSTAEEFLATGGRGLTADEFYALSGYGEIDSFPRCNGDQVLGNYRFSAYCEGDQHDSNLVVGEIYKQHGENGTEILMSRPFKSAEFPDTSELLETYLFIYTSSITDFGDKTIQEAFQHHEHAIDEVAGSVQDICYFLVGLFGLIGLGCLSKKNGSSSSSSSS